jgi:hypothetical protein
VGHPAQQLREPLQAAPVGGGGRGAQRQQRSEAEAGLAFGERAGQHGVGELDRGRLPTLQRREQLEQGAELPTPTGRSTASSSTRCNARAASRTASRNDGPVSSEAR